MIFLRSFYLIVFFSQINLIYSQKISRGDYIKKYNKIAITQMQKHKIPASITLAQGILESGDGNSRLAIKANNHFGIKCHKGWNGEKIHEDDDKKNECFRVYKSARESYEDHSLFLLKYDRYAFLFEYNITDYKSWAKGLKKAGYATNSKYDELLIKIIDENQLFIYDKKNSNNETQHINISRKIYLHENNIKYIWSQKDETYYDIAKEFNMGLWQLYKYNDVDHSHELMEGEVIFLQPKRNKAKVKIHTIKINDTLRSISQFYGVKLKKIHKRNNGINVNALKAGEEIILR